MIITNDRDFSPIGETIIEVSELEELSQELIDGFIDAQIKRPYDIRSNFVENFTEEYEKLMIVQSDDDEALATLRADAREFYEDIIARIDKRYKLDIDFDVVEELDFSGVKNVCEALYEFFIVNYTKNIAKYLARITMANREEIVNELNSRTEIKDVSTIGQIEKLGDNDYAVIMANINDTLSIAKSIMVDPLDFITLYNADHFDVAVLQSCIENHVINGDFVGDFIGYIFGDAQDYIYDEVVASVQQRILKFYEDEFGG